MDYDIPESIPQGSDRAQEAENRRIAEIADELSRLCRIHETQLGVGKDDVNTRETEQRAAEQLAKSQGFWIPMMDISVLEFLARAAMKTTLMSQSRGYTK